MCDFFKLTPKKKKTTFAYRIPSRIKQTTQTSKQRVCIVYFFFLFPVRFLTAFGLRPPPITTWPTALGPILPPFFALMERSVCLNGESPTTMSAVYASNVFSLRRGLVNSRWSSRTRMLLTLPILGSGAVYRAPRFDVRTRRGARYLRGVEGLGE
jgi:hypothetical protein